jgi:hypothetical protein
MASDPTAWPEDDLLVNDDEDSAAGALEPGLLTSPQPLGLEDRSDVAHASSPDRVFSQWQRPKGLRRHMLARTTLAGIPLPGQKDDQETEDDETKEARKDKGQSRGAQALTYIRGKLSEDGLAGIQAMVNDPGLALTTIQRDIVLRLGQYGRQGDKTGVRRALMDLVEKVDVSSPKDGAVLVAREEAGEMLSSNVSGQLARLEGGKRSLEMTQGGRVVGQIQSILGQHKAFGWTDGLDRGWRRLTERFGQHANGTIDVVVGSNQAGMPGAAAAESPGAAPQTPVGSWNVSPGAGAAPESAPVGSWVMPGSGNPGPAGQPPVGQWTIGGEGAAPAASPGDAGGIGKWAMPGSGGTGAGAAAGPGSAAPAVGQWAVPPGDAAAATPEGGAPAIGKWNVAGAGSDPGAPAVGKWNVAGPEGAAPDATPAGAKVGQWTTGADIPVAADLNLSDILRQNPNISNVRLVELAQSAEGRQPPRLRAITEIARSLFGKRFGF